MKKRKPTIILSISLLIFSLHFLSSISKSEPPTQAPNSFVPIIVESSDTPLPSLKALVDKIGGKVTKEFTYLNGFSAVIPTNIPHIPSKELKGVTVTLDHPVRPSMDITRPTVGADTAQESFGLDGNGIGVAIIDSGINDHEDLASNPLSRIVYSENFVANEPTTRDLFGHGTHVAGIVAGDGKASSGEYSFRTIKGIAPGARLINLRVLDSQGSGMESDVIAAVERAIALKDKYNIRIINLSLGSGATQPYVRDPLCRIVNLAWSRGIVVVAAAGNFGNTQFGPYGLITSPGNSPYVITVGATNSNGTTDLSDDSITSYSSRGPTLFDNIVKPDLVAPGNRVKSLLAKDSILHLDPTFSGNLVDPSYYLSYSSSSNVEYLTLSGTSMAAPVVAGAVALMLQKDPAISNNTIKLRLMASAKKIFAQRYDLLTVGAGLLDIPAALQNNLVTANCKSPYLKRDQKNPNVYLVVDGNWNSQKEWSTGVIWGVNIDQDSSAIWGGSTIWNNGVIWGVYSPFSDPSANLINSSSQREISISGDE